MEKGDRGRKDSQLTQGWPRRGEQMEKLPSIIDHKLRSDLTGSKNVEGMSKIFAYFRLFFTFLNGVT